MSFLMFLGIAASIAYGMGTAASDIKTKSCKKELNKEQYSLNQFEQILRLCRVKRINYDGFKILEECGFKYCIDYVRRQPLTTEDDVRDFINKYNSVRNAEIREFLCYWEDIYNATYEQEIDGNKCSNVITFEKKHYLSTYEKAYNHAQELFEDTFFGELAVARPKIIVESNAVVEVWALHCDNLYLANKYYEMCSKVLGKLTV